MLKQRAAQKIGDEQGARPTAVPALMFSTLYCTLTIILNSCSVAMNEVKAEYIE